ncbi:type IV secretion system protein [uncultured Erythrobacter sp.]|uniref:type IV secretion system protein n=1 Tax=uncultured Erythrobacter sp. TaxID=263913 RepID=UPI0026023A11|nr:type IV secretion system protein [uncultured Erythrobacter sp.]
MTTSCDLVAQEVGSGVAAALTAVDCIATNVSEEAFNRLFGADGQLGVALTIALTLYVAFFGFSLILGRSNLSIRAFIPKMMTIGLVLTFATSFAVFQQFFYSIFVLTPDWLATQITDSDGSATATFAAKLDVVFLVVQEASQGQENISLFSPPGMMWAGAMLLLLGTAGLLVTARIGLALLLAIGPIFVVLGLFNGTRGLFVGWLKGLVMLALAPLFAVVGGSIMLEIAVPVLAALVAQPGQIDPQAAMAFFVVGFVHALLMIMVLKVSSNMVAGWQVFGLAKPDVPAEPGVETARMGPQQMPSVLPVRSGAAGPAQVGATAPRRVDVAMASAYAANDAGPVNTHTTCETKVFATSSARTQTTSASAAASRTRGIGNRFRTAGAHRKSETG